MATRHLLLAYYDTPSFFGVVKRLGVHHQTVQRCVERAESDGPVAALDDRPRPGKEPVITPMQHLAEIARDVDEDAHAVLIIDQAGWHMPNNLVVPENITILPLPPKSPELDPVENLWLFMRDNWLSNRIFTSYDDIVAHCCDAWRKLESQPYTCPSAAESKQMGFDQ